MRLRAGRAVTVFAAGAAVALMGALPATAQSTQAATQSDLSWQQQSPPTSPDPAGWGAMAYDAADNETVLFGGESASGLSDSTWTWDGSAWTQLHPAHSPSARYFEALAYDPVRQQIVLFGGDTADATVGDTWVFSAGKWTHLHPAASPPAVRGASMAFDSKLQQMVLFGGIGDAGGATDDMFTWDGTTWTQLNPAVVPGPREEAGFAYDAHRNALVLFGGYDADGAGSGTYLRDTWSWDGTTWTQLSLKHTPTTRLSPSMTSFGSSVEMFGGIRQNHGQVQYLDETWVLTNKSWRKAHIDTVPQARFGAPAAWDPVSDEVVLFSGRGQGTLDDTWTLSESDARMPASGDSSTR